MDNTEISALQTEVEFYRNNHTIVEQEIKMLIADNQKLSHQLGVLLKEKLENEKQSADSNQEQSKELDELKRQVALFTKERDSLHVLWQTAQRTIEALETELKTYHCYDNRGKQLNDMENKRELELKLETALTDYIELEAKYKELQTKNSTLLNDAKIKEKEIASYKERGKELEIKIEELTKNLEEYKINLAAEKKSREDLKKQLAFIQKELVEKIKKHAEAKSKVAEALELYDIVRKQKNDANATIKQQTAELNRVKRALCSVKDDLEAVYRKEIDEMKDKYNEKIVDMLVHIKNLDAELVEKGLLLNKVQRENQILSQANENYIKQHNEELKSLEPKLRIAEQRMEIMFQELVSSERRNVQLVCEKQCLALDVQRIQEIQARETKRRDWEEKLLKNRCEELTLQLENSQKSLNETHEMVNKLQAMMSSRAELSQKIISTKEDELNELNKHLENQMELSKKWKESYVEMTEKLKKQLNDLENENSELRMQLKLPNSGLIHDDSTES
ncbi:tropomyosin beta chain-like [Bombyx mandarina]|uniref:Tropomyosin beta chain-like n=1 Tax=Bombyx mandarina TaxID=7092 RepID=A0A6J2JJN7_BOMMA|nr:tropomyosin beta chain-like [Bombyx mandarina]